MTTPGTADEFSLLDEEAAAFAIAVPARPTVGRRTVAGSDGRTLSALVWGDGVPQLALLHGGGLNARNGRALPQPRRRRRPRRPCRRPRHPGLEDSPMKPPFPYYGGKTRPSAVDHRAAPAARDLPKSWSEQSAGLAKPWDGKGAKP